MSKFPIYRQHDAMDCGATCIRMVAKHYGRELSLDYLRQQCYTSKDGVSLMSLSDTLETLGFKTLGGKVTLYNILNAANYPCILHWEGNHFIVLYAVKRKHNNYKIYIADPKRGRVELNIDEFKNSWISTISQGDEKGIALLIEPTEQFYIKQQNDFIKPQNRTPLGFLAKYFKKYKKLIAQLALGLMLGSAIQLILPFLTQAIVDKGIRTKDIGLIYLIMLAQLALFVGRISIYYLRRWILLHISVRINISLLSDFLIKLAKLPMAFFDTTHLGDLIQRMNDHERVQHFLTSQSLSALFSIFNLIIFGSVLFFYSVKIFFIFILGSVIYILWIFLFLKKRKKLDYKLFDQRAKSQNITYQLIYGMQEMKLQNCERSKRWEWEDVQAEQFNLHVEALGLEQKQETGNMLIDELKNIIITITSAISVINNEMTLGMMLATQYIIGQLNSPIEQTIRLIQDYQDARISLERINEIHVKEEENENKPQNQTKSLTLKNISINNLSFQYEGPHSPKVLNNINLLIPEGKVTAIVGHSGSGKTTLIKMLLQYYYPSEGTITVNGEYLQSFNSRWWRNQCGAVMQDGYIFSDTIAKNIAISDDEINIERLKYAVQVANIDKFINALPLRYETRIGAEGQNISQGQRQRILIARAVYKNPDFLFFDEATNSLDAENERAIVHNLQTFYNKKTVVIVAHRLSTVKHADQIAVLNNGQLVELGTHNELVERKGFYLNLVKNQLELGS